LKTWSSATVAQASCADKAIGNFCPSVCHSLVCVFYEIIFGARAVANAKIVVAAFAGYFKAKGCDTVWKVATLLIRLLSGEVLFRSS
jgi:hypothetical protein